MRRGIFILGIIILALLGLGAGLLSRGQQPAPPWVVVIDAGHGGEDTGAIGLQNIIEKDLVLAITRIVQIQSLNDPQIKIVLSRPEDKYLSPQDRIQLANERKASLYLSVHANYANDPLAQGIETLIHTSTSPQSKEWAQLVQKNLTARTKAKDRGVKSAPLYLRSAQMPAVLVEVGFTTNPEEASKLQELTYQTLIAETILNTARLFLGQLQSK
jgi:N-acetylmuramoyl-L-alanine amidase